jgi:hypothetical protein
MMKLTSLLVALLATSGLALAAKAPAHSPASPDVIGLRLGMTEQEAVAVLRAYNPAVRIRKVTDTLPTSPATRFTTTLYAGFFGDDRAGVGDEVVKIEFTNPTPVPRVLGIWRKQSFLPGRELSMANTTAAIREKYGPPLFTHTATGLTLWTWATGFAGRPPPGLSSCGGGYSPVDTLATNLVTSAFIEPRAFFNAPDCGMAINVTIVDAGGLVTTLGTSLTDYAVGVRAREELEAMSRRPDTRAIEAEQRGKPKL